MLRYYRIDLRATWMGARRLLVLIRGLPADSATHRDDAWTLRDEVLARTLEATDYWGRVAAVLLGNKDAQRTQPPMMVQSPARLTAKPKPKPTTDPRVIAAWLDAAGGTRA